MNSKDIVNFGLLGIAAYAAYKVLPSLTKTVEQVGSGVGTAVSETGQGVGGLVSPLAAFGNVGSEARLNRTMREDIYRRGLQEAAPITIATAVGKAKVKSLKQDTKVNIQQYKTDSTAQSLNNNFSEEVQRKTEYGATTGQYLRKVFMPTREVAQLRRENLKSNTKAVVNTLKKVVSAPPKAAASAISKTTKKAKTLLKSIAKKVKRK